MISTLSQSVNVPLLSLSRCIFCLPYDELDVLLLQLLPHCHCHCRWRKCGICLRGTGKVINSIVKFASTFINSHLPRPVCLSSFPSRSLFFLPQATADVLTSASLSKQQLCRGQRGSGSDVVCVGRSGRGSGTRRMDGWTNWLTSLCVSRTRGGCCNISCLVVVRRKVGEEQGDILNF